MNKCQKKIEEHSHYNHQNFPTVNITKGDKYPTQLVESEVKVKFFTEKSFNQGRGKRAKIQITYLSLRVLPLMLWNHNMGYHLLLFTSIWHQYDLTKEVKIQPFRVFIVLFFHVKEQNLICIGVIYWQWRTFYKNEMTLNKDSTSYSLNQIN